MNGSATIPSQPNSLLIAARRDPTGRPRRRDLSCVAARASCPRPLRGLPVHGCTLGGPSSRAFDGRDRGVACTWIIRPPLGASARGPSRQALDKTVGGTAARAPSPARACIRLSFSAIRAVATVTTRRGSTLVCTRCVFAARLSQITCSAKPERRTCDSERRIRDSNPCRRRERAASTALFAGVSSEDGRS
jgi:hypothetical protein